MGSNLLGIMGEQGKNTKQIFNDSKEWIIIYVTILGGQVGKWNKTRKKKKSKMFWNEKHERVFATTKF